MQRRNTQQVSGWQAGRTSDQRFSNGNAVKRRKRHRSGTISVKVFTITRSRLINLAIGGLVTATCLVAALWGIDYRQVAASFAQANYVSLPMMLVLVGLFFWLKAIRWKLLLGPLRQFRTVDIVPAMLVGFMGNNLLPAHLGDVARAVVLGKQYKLSKTAVFSTVVLERVFDIVAILACFAFALVFVKGLPESYHVRTLYFSGVIAAGVLGLIAYVIWTEAVVCVAERVLKYFSFLPERIRAGLIKMLRVGADGLTTVRDIKLVLAIMAISLIHWLLNGCMICIGLWAFGIDRLIENPILASLVVLGVTALGVTVPSTPGFFGLIQLCFQISLTPFGVAKEDALAVSVYYHMIWYVPVTLVGLWYLNRLGLRLGQLEQESEREELESASAELEADAECKEPSTSDRQAP